MSVEDEHTETTDPSTSPLKFGNEVQIERGERVPSLDFAETCDRVFPHAYGRFGS